MKKSIVKLSKPHQRWVFGGIGFQNSEASMTGVMTQEFKDQVVLKCFREISPTYSRVFTGFAYWNKPDMDRFADYYDQRQIRSYNRADSDNAGRHTVQT